jgi:Phytanoyl-CoA dioxygenase (PhyH)
MAIVEPLTQLRKEGVVLLRNFFPREPLMRLRDAAIRCFAAIESGRPVPEHFRFSPQAHSVVLPALLEFAVGNEETVLEPLSSDGPDEMFSAAVDGHWRCMLEHSWARKKFAPRNAPGPGYHRQDWHQDGALGAQFPLQPGPVIPIQKLATCWIPLDACGTDSPGLEFIRQLQPALLHFTELDDSVLRRRFGAEAFWVPGLEFGDGLIFLDHVLHRTHINAEMRGNRLSVEYRIFPKSPSSPRAV